MDRKHNKRLVPFARYLRKNQTKEERRLWYDFLRFYPVKFYRQRIIGKYIVDFYSATAKIIIELDGSQHYAKSGIKRDLQRDNYLKEYGLRIIHIQNTDVNENFYGVCEYIDRMIRQL